MLRFLLVCLLDTVINMIVLAPVKFYWYTFFFSSVFFVDLLNTYSAFRVSKLPQPCSHPCHTMRHEIHLHVPTVALYDPYSLPYILVNLSLPGRS